jgi:UDP-N-acetylmuramate--alanine ligase
MIIYCSGIGGIGLSAYAALQKAAGHSVSGSDKADSALIESLRTLGIAVSLDQSGAAIPEGCELLVYSEAVPEDAPERRLARERGIRSISYFHGLGEISKGKKVIAVCGTHGKSSTTAMVARVLIEAGLDPTVVVGTKVRELDGRNFRTGKSDWFVLEACEYRRSFHHLSPTIVLMTNVDGDHFDAYKDLAEYQQSFVDFLKLLPADGVVITHGQVSDCRRVVEQSGHALTDADDLQLPTLTTPGLHMQRNGQLVLRLAERLGIAEAAARKSLAGFAGTWRRLEEVGTRSDGVTVIDDYAHHPVEIAASLQGVKSGYPGRRIVVAFQPHTHDRTIKLYDEFLSSFKDADLVIVPNIYAARNEVDSATVDPETFVADIARESGITGLYGRSLEETLQRLQTEILRPGDVVVTMGAGDITTLAKKFLAA